jgi:hypothetical protein
LNNAKFLLTKGTAIVGNSVGVRFESSLGGVVLHNRASPDLIAQIDLRMSGHVELF